MAQEYKGKSVYKGIVLGPIVVFKKNDVLFCLATNLATTKNKRVV